MAQQRPRPKVPGYILEAKIGSGTFADVFRAHQISVRATVYILK